MTFLDTMKNRYTTKKYDKTKKLTKEQLEDLKQIVHLAPSSINGQPWKITFVEDEAMKEKFAEASMFNKEKINDATALVVFSAIDNLEIFEKQAKENLPEMAFGYYENFLKPQSEEVVKNWFSRQVYLALGVFLSACAEMKIDSTPMEGIETQKYNELLKQEGNYTALFAVAVGLRDENDENQPSITPKIRVDFDTIIETI